jgi:catechol 2,3-dioxygenase-like lactoylglutathione lyase family enzyme
MLTDARIVYLFLYVRDLAVARAFYADTLGLDVIEEDEGCVKLDAGQCILALNRAADYGIELPERRDNSTDIVFLVDDAEAVRAGLAKRGVRFLPTDRYQVGTIIDFYDPDGHWLTLYEVSEEALGWPSGERIAALREARNGRGPVAGPTLAGSELVYIFFFVPDADEAESFYREFLGLSDLEGGPCSQQTTGDEDGVIKYDTGAPLLTTHFYVDAGRNAERAPDGEEPDEHACPPRDLDARRMQGAAPAFLVPDVDRVVAELTVRRPSFAVRLVSRSDAVGIVYRCEDPSGHLFFLYEPSDAAARSPSGVKLAEIAATPFRPVRA